MTEELLKKYQDLKDYFIKAGRVAIAYSSGVDSTFLLFAAHEALGEDAIAITATSCSFPKRESQEAIEYCKKLGVRQFIVEADELSVEGFAQNPPERCYLCKKDLFKRIIEVAETNSATDVCEGSNLDDEGDYRPGLKAIAELQVKSPLRQIGFTKQEIRQLSEYLGIPTFDKPSFACLSSRFPYGEEITREKLEMVDNSEQLLLDLGFKQFRVRIHGNVARIELLPEEFEKIMEEKTRNLVYDKFKEYGFAYTALDLKGYRTGAMNETLGGAK